MAIKWRKNAIKMGSKWRLMEQNGDKMATK